jgi:hypothetical protein
MSHQEAKAIAAQVIRDLLDRYPPGLVVMVIQSMRRMQRASKDITIIAEPQKPGATPPENHPPRE